MEETLNKRIQETQIRIDNIQTQIHVLESKQKQHIDELTYLKRIKEERHN